MNYTFTKYTFNIPEIVTYFAYIYSLIALAVLIKPTRALYLIMFSLCTIATYTALASCNFFSFKRKQIFLISFIYTIPCAFALYLIHKTWKYFKKDILYKLALIFLPFFYYIGMKTYEYIANCGTLHNYNTLKSSYHIVTFVNYIIVFAKLKKLI